jgi:hypothetical protein
MQQLRKVRQRLGLMRAHLILSIDEDYISFIESLKAPANAEPVTIEALGTILYVTDLTAH